MTTSKRCGVCSLEKPLTEFTKRQAKSGVYYRYACKRCIRAQNQARQLVVRKARKAAMASRGIVTDRCNICGVTEAKVAASGKGPSAALHSDHCHGSGEDRGVLCLSCNVGLGHFKDDPALLASAIKYLKRVSAKPGD